MSGFLSILKRNHEDIMKTIEQACRRAGRNPADVTLVAVTKNVHEKIIAALPGIGITDIGENRVQEAKSKPVIGDGRFRRHMIGHLQTNKAARAVELFEIIHSVDGDRLARKLQSSAAANGKTMPVFLQMNTSGERSKSGVNDFAEAERISTLIRAECPNLKLAGLMTMAPATDDMEVVRSCFRALRASAERLRLSALSMGMSGDYAIAVEEGATHLRIGTALFDGVLESWQN